MKHHHLLAVACAALLAAPLHGLAQAQKTEKLRLGVFGSGKGSGPLMSKAELKECLAIQQRIASGGEAGKQEREAIERDKAELLRVADDLKATREKVDLTSQEQVDQYNAKVKARETMLQAYDQRVAAFNQNVESLQGERNAFTTRCDGRRFDQVDEEELRKGK